MRTLLVLLLLALLSACGGSGNGEATVRVFAAASLTESFTELGERFKEDHPGTEVELNFGPSSSLAAQIAGGAPADVFAPASPVHMDKVAGDVADPQDFATNRMAIAVPPDNPAGIDSLADLAPGDVKVAVCQPQVPCGATAAEVFANAKITVKPATEEVDVKSVLTKVSLGEVDAGVVYVTDVLAAEDEVQGVEIPEDQNATTSYPIATLTGSDHARLAAQFVDLVLSDAGARVLADAGFERP